MGTNSVQIQEKTVRHVICSTFEAR